MAASASTNANVQLWIRLDDQYRLTLSIPVAACPKFSSHPLTWLRFLAYAIHGKKADYRPNCVDISAGDYYYVPEDDHYLLDPKTMDDRTSTTSNLSSRRANFRDDVVARDGSCVMTGAEPALCVACHIIPHAKGDQYIKNLISYRGQVVNPPILTIDDARNGILLNPMLQVPFGSSAVAFLQTPNFAMNTGDVPLAERLGPVLDFVQFDTPRSNTNSRLTFHNFDYDYAYFNAMAPHNAVARQSDRDNSPPSFLFDIAYGIAALKTWGQMEFLQFAEGQTKDFYYHEGDDDGDSVEGDDIYSVAARVRRKKTVRPTSANRHSRTEMPASKQVKPDDSQAIDVFDIVMGLWVRNARKDMRRARMMKEKQTRDSVQKWLESAV